MKKSVYNFIDFALLIIDPKMLLYKLLGLPNLTKTWVFYVYKLIQIIMVDKD